MNYPLFRTVSGDKENGTNKIYFGATQIIEEDLELWVYDPALATVALAVNSVPRVAAAPPGLRSMIELPVPAAMLGDARQPAREDRSRG